MNILLQAFQMMHLQIAIVYDQSNLHPIQKFVPFQQMLSHVQQLKAFQFQPVLLNSKKDGVQMYYF